ncbi:MAG: C-24(28) sterol reductase [Claussenomyces sp. TS43310]|nr:MAG: C-24(28) sterol reductase [Claussenomyces sp. TS43310]
MSERTRYSLRATPKKADHYPGVVETPRARKSRRKSQFPETDERDSSSATDSASAPTLRRPSGKTSMNKELVPNRTAEAKVKTKYEDYLADADGKVNGSGRVNGNGKIHGDGNTYGGKQDPKIDGSGEYHFGGPLGVSAGMVGYPILMWYMWIGATYYDGKFPTREPGQSFVDFAQHLGSLVYEGAFPSLRAWKIYWTYLVFEVACYCLLPGVWAHGKPLPHENGKQLKYYCSGVASFYFTMVVVAVLHFTGIFPLYTLLDEFGPIMSVAICSGYLVSIVAYISALMRGAQHRMTGNHIYDFFMGAELNPSMFGILDFKMFFEVRLPWYILLGLSCAAAARQYEQFGYVSAEVCFLVMAHFLYANACSKGEECIVTTW